MSGSPHRDPAACRGSPHWDPVASWGQPIESPQCPIGTRWRVGVTPSGPSGVSGSPHREPVACRGHSIESPQCRGHPIAPRLAGVGQGLIFGSAITSGKPVQIQCSEAIYSASNV